MITRTRLRPTFPILLLCGVVVFVSTLASAAEPQWIRVNSSHFSVLTDAGDKKGREVILRFEQMRAVFAQLLMKTRLHMPVPLEIIALKTDKEYAQVVPMSPTNSPTCS